MKNLLKTKRAEGFTIIEVMIVLAIAGLIMVIVFIAVPQLQRQQRNNARENVVNRVATEANNFASNNTGRVPTIAEFTGVAGGFYTRYINNNASQFQDPSTGVTMIFKGDTIANVNTALTASPLPANYYATVYYATGAICSGETVVAGSNNNFAVANILEGGSVHCVDNK
jgi:prepilin-type N-terminal cleavage/methylation domain-containing protein